MIYKNLEMVCAFVAALHVYNSCRNRRKLKGIALISPKNSPWTRLYRYGDDDSFMTRLQTRLFDEPTERERVDIASLLECSLSIECAEDEVYRIQ
jgi:hypothetical protein